jgi:hypothetical protein
MRTTALRSLHARAKVMPAHGTRAPIGAPPPLARNIARIRQVRSCAGCIRTHRLSRALRRGTQFVRFQTKWSFCGQRRNRRRERDHYHRGHPVHGSRTAGHLRRHRPGAQAPVRDRVPAAQGTDGTFRRISVGVLEPRLGVAPTRAGDYADRGAPLRARQPTVARPFVDEGVGKCQSLPLRRTLGQVVARPLLRARPRIATMTNR